MPKLWIAMPTRGQPVFEALTALINAAACTPGDKGLEFPRGAPRDRNRNWICKRFLDDSAAEWLVMVDDDTTVPPDAIRKLLAVNKPFVCAVEPLLLGDVTAVNVCYDMPEVDKPVTWPAWWEWDTRKAPHPVKASGFGCVLMHRSVLTDIGAPWFREFFQETDGTGFSMTEDIWFCQRAAACGYELWVEPSVICEHWKMLPLGQFMAIRQLQKAAEQEVK